MELYERILCETIARDVIPSLQVDWARLVELKCYQTILEIYNVVFDDALDDAACFQRVELNVCALDEPEIGGGGRHDF